MITIEHLRYFYPHKAEAALDDFSLTIPAGAYVLVSGVSGAGKSTLLRALNGLVPHFYGGRFAGRVLVDGLDTRLASPRELAGTVGFVFQDPTAQFTMQVVEDELAFGLENLAVPRGEMVGRIEEVLKAVGGEHLRGRRVETLSGGEAQRVAVASALVMQPKILVLDEPTSQLDPPSAVALLAILRRLHREVGMTIILAEHRLGRVLPDASHLLVLRPHESPLFGDPHELVKQAPLRPPYIEAALHLGWPRLPYDLADAQAIAQTMPAPSSKIKDDGVVAELGAPLVEIRDLEVGYNTAKPVLRGLDLDVPLGGCVALLGANGSGKSTLLKSLAGLLKPERGSIHFRGKDILGQRIEERAQLVAYVPQDPNSLLFAESLLDELNFTLRGLKLSPVALPDVFLAELGLGSYAAQYPRDLSGGERQRAALAAMLIAERPLVVLDEPTMGLDYLQRQRLVRLVAAWKARGQSVLLATHDLELAARVADWVAILAAGRVDVQGSPREILLKKAGYRTQLAQIFGRGDILTTDDLA